MNTTYRRMLLVMLVVAGSAATLRGQDWSKVKIRTIPIADHLYVLANGGGNMVLSVGDDGPLLIDSGFEELTEKVIAAAGAVSKAPVRLVINTHWHFDHVGGNAGLARAGACIVAHESVRKQMSAERYLTVIDRRIPASPAVALPTVTFADSLTVHWNGDELYILHVGPAHSDGDSVVLFRKANVLHVADIWFNGMYPFIDVNDGGSIDGFVRALDRALALANEETRIVPGHGPLANKAELRVYRDMLATVRDRVRALLAQGKSRAEVIAAKPTKEFDGRWGQQWLDPDTWTGLVYDGMVKP